MNYNQLRNTEIALCYRKTDEIGKFIAAFLWFTVIYVAENRGWVKLGPEHPLYICHRKSVYWAIQPFPPSSPCFLGCCNVHTVGIKNHFVLHEWLQNCIKQKGGGEGVVEKVPLIIRRFLCHIQRLSNPLNDPHEQQLKDGEGWTLSFMKKIEKYCITQSDGSHEKTRQFCLMLHQVISSSTAF